MKIKIAVLKYKILGIIFLADYEIK